MSEPSAASAAGAVERLKPGMQVFVPGMSGESLAFFEALQANPARCAGVTFVGVHYPGINTTDYLALHPAARQRAYFMAPSARAALAAGRLELIPADYPGIVRDLTERAPPDVALAQLSLPDEQGWCSLGVSYDFLPTVWARARLRIAHLNPRLPRTRGSFAVRAGDWDFTFEAEADIPGLRADEPDELARRQAAFIAALVPDGATLQFGVGKLQAAVLNSLVQHRGLRIYSGMVSTPVLRLLDSGALAGAAVIECGVALGDAAFYQRIGRDDAFYFRPVSETHDVRRIGAIERFCALNSALSVDLFGQVNAEAVNGRLVAGAGGLPAFVAGARLSAGGRSIIALPATADGGATSRITATAAAPGLTTLARHDPDYVVTEFGVAALRSRSVAERAQALIEIAAPAFRARLQSEWEELARRF